MHVTLAKDAISIGAALGLNKANFFIVANGFDRQVRHVCHFTNIQIAPLRLTYLSSARSNIPQPQRIDQNKNGGQRHSRCGKDGRKHYAKGGIESASRHWDQSHIIPKGPE